MRNHKLMAELIIREDRDGWCSLSLNRPAKLNALTTALFRELRSHVEMLRTDGSVRCVVLRGMGDCFSVGYDLGAISAVEDTPPPGWHSETLRLLELLPQPVIAAVHGHCYTGALEVALACDFIVAADTARFGDTHAKWALTPIWGMTQRLPRRIGLAAAKRLMFTTDMIGAAEAVRIGLAEYAVPLSAFDAEIEMLASRIAAQSPFTHGSNKYFLDASDGLALDTGLQLEVLENRGIGPDASDRIAAFAGRGK